MLSLLSKEVILNTQTQMEASTTKAVGEISEGLWGFLPCQYVVPLACSLRCHLPPAFSVVVLSASFKTEVRRLYLLGYPGLSLVFLQPERRD